MQESEDLTSLLDITPTVLDWFGIPYPNYTIIKKPVELTGRSLLPSQGGRNSTPPTAVFASHNIHEITMYYPMRVIRTHRFKLIQNLNYKMPFPIDQDFYISPTFQDLLNRTRKKQPLHWFKTLQQYYYRDAWELYDLQADPKETRNLAGKAEYEETAKGLLLELNRWQNVTADPWICAPTAVLEDSGNYKLHPQCMAMDNDLQIWPWTRDISDEL